jgi:hypothetical protein
MCVLPSFLSTVGPVSFERSLLDDGVETKVHDNVKCLSYLTTQ